MSAVLFANATVLQPLVFETCAARVGKSHDSYAGPAGCSSFGNHLGVTSALCRCGRKGKKCHQTHHSVAYCFRTKAFMDRRGGMALGSPGDLAQGDSSSVEEMQNNVNFLATEQACTSSTSTSASTTTSMSTFTSTPISSEGSSDSKPEPGVGWTSYEGELQPQSMSNLKERFELKGVRFIKAADTRIIQLRLADGCEARIVLDDARITSYKAVLYHGGSEEMLHCKLMDVDWTGQKQQGLIRGGVTLDFLPLTHKGTSFTSSMEEGAKSEEVSLVWNVVESKCKFKKYAKVVLEAILVGGGGGGDGKGKGTFNAKVITRYSVTLRTKALDTKLEFCNAGDKESELSVLIMNWLATGVLSGTQVLGLMGCDRRDLIPVPRVDPPSQASLRTRAGNDSGHGAILQLPSWGGLLRMFGMDGGSGAKMRDGAGPLEKNNAIPDPSVGWKQADDRTMAEEAERDLISSLSSAQGADAMSRDHKEINSQEATVAAFTSRTSGSQTPMICQDDKDAFSSKRDTIGREEQAKEEVGEADNDSKNMGWEEETEPLLVVRSRMERFYRNVPSGFILLDRGLRRSLLMERKGFEDVLISHPGFDDSGVARDDAQSFLCIGQGQVNQEITLLPGQTWKGTQTIRLHE